jgi:hypothetical protein
MMKRMMIGVSLVVLLGTTLWAQSAGTSAPVSSTNPGQARQQGDHDGDGVPNGQDKGFARPSTGSTAQTGACDPAQRPGKGLGDGSKPRPRDGTGFGARAGKGNGQNGQAGQGQGQRRRLRDGSCPSNSSAVTTGSTTDPTTSRSIGPKNGRGQGNGRCGRR